MSDEARLASLRKLAAGLAHDLNNILGGISGLASASLLEVRQGPVADDLRQIIRTAKEGLAVASRLATLAHSASPKKSPTEARALFSSLVQSFSTKGAIEVVGAEEAVVSIDPKLLQEALSILLQNALEASPHAPVRLWLERTQSELVFCVSNQNSQVLPPIRELSEPYYSTKTEGRGRGLGLTLAWSIAAGHGGSVQLTSQGTETIARLSLPLELEVTQSQAKETAKKTILIADDERLMRQALERLLTRGGYRVISASDGQEALDLFLANQDSISLVLLDRWMPRLNGLEATKQIQRLAPDLPALLTSGDPEDLEALQREGVRAYVEKPFESGELLRLLREILGAKP